MKTGPRKHLVRDVCNGFVYNNEGQESMTSKGGIHGKA